jgi:hypothetical protein
MADRSIIQLELRSYRPGPARRFTLVGESNSGKIAYGYRAEWGALWRVSSSRLISAQQTGGELR